MIDVKQFACCTILVLTLCLVGCGDEPSLPMLTPGDTVLAFGDSLTQGSGASMHESYPSVLQDLLSVKVVNAGIPGETSRQGRARLKDLLESVHPTLLILCHGGNDFLRHMDERQLRENLNAMVAMARERGVSVLLLGVPRPSLVSLKTANVYYDVAAQWGIPLEDEILARVIGDKRMISDSVHPNAKGYHAIAEALYERLKNAVKSG